MLLMTDVSKTYPSGSVALRDVNIHIQPGNLFLLSGRAVPENPLLLRCFFVR